MVVLEAYIDEHVSGIVCAAGYVFEPEPAKIFAERWSPYLVAKGIDVFHATDCFRRSDWGEISSNLAALITETTRCGAVQFVLKDALVPMSHGVQQFIGSPYSLCVLSCMEQIAELAKADEKILYFIEDGNRFAGEVRHFLNQIKDSPKLKDDFRLMGADTYSKKDVIQLQAADLLAWALGRSHRENIFVSPLSALFKHPHYVSGFSEASAGTQALVNSFNGLKSNRTRFD